MKHIQHNILMALWFLRLHLRRWLHLSMRPGITSLLNSLEAERSNLEATFADLSETKMTTPGVLNDWSVKDILAHIAIWDERGTGWIKTAAQGRIPIMPAPGYTWKDMDQLNEQTFVENKGRPLPEVMAEFQRTYQHLLEQIRKLSGRSAGNPVVAELINWRRGHYKSHAAQIRTWQGKDTVL